MHFGQFLICAGLATPAQLLEALEIQFQSTPLVGRLAVERGYLSVEAVLVILDEQSRSHMPFLRQALALGFLDESRAGDLLQVQLASIESLGSILVKRGAINRTQLAQALRRYRTERSSDVDRGWRSLPSA